MFPKLLKDTTVTSGKKPSLRPESNQRETLRKEGGKRGSGPEFLSEGLDFAESMSVPLQEPVSSLFCLRRFGLEFLSQYQNMNCKSLQANQGLEKIFFLGSTLLIQCLILSSLPILTMSKHSLCGCHGCFLQP